jgi:flavocytochrome c
LVVVAAIATYLALSYYNPLLMANQGPSIQRNTTIVVVGGGLAGLSATIEAYRAGAHVTLLEKEPRLGGNSAKASSGINAVGTSAQNTTHSTDTKETFKQDTLKSGGGACNEDLVDLLVRNSADAIDFLSSFGVDLSELSKCGGHSDARTHRAKPPPPDKPARNIGFEITSKLIEYVNTVAKDNNTSEAKGSIKIINGAKATKLMVDSSSSVVDGIEYVDGSGVKHELRADAVILTTGGYAADRKGLLEQYAPAIAHLATTNGPWALGEGVRLAQGVGAKLVLMDQVQVHPTGFVDPSDPANPTKFLAPEALRAVGGILINKEAKRFVDELSLRNAATAAIFKHGFKMENGPTAAYLVMNDEAVNKFGAAALKFYKGKGFIVQYANAKEFAEAAGIDESTLRKTLSDYNTAKESGGADEFGKTTFPVAFDADANLHVILVTPSIHYTMGGAAINTKAQVLHETEGKVIQGLYAAGEVSGGVHGNNRLAGNSLLECVVFGRIAGQQASK